jgi:CheY-like chemotaxis protein
MKGDEKKAFDAGCTGYITKPIDTRRFSLQVAAFLPPATERRAVPVHKHPRS